MPEMFLFFVNPFITFDSTDCVWNKGKLNAVLFQVVQSLLLNRWPFFVTAGQLECRPFLYKSCPRS